MGEDECGELVERFWWGATTITIIIIIIITKTPKEETITNL